MSLAPTQALDGTDPLAHGLVYSSLGWRIIPIPPGYKYPEGFGRWQDIATTDTALITQWYTTWPQHGIGIACGARSGIFALDVDPAHGGDDTLAALEAQHGKLPETVEAITGGGGRHLIFAWPTDLGGKRLGNSAGKLGPGLDIRAEGGQIVAAPTIHPDSGRRYEWEASSHPGAVPVAVALPWLIALLLEDVIELPPQAPSALDSAFAWDAYEALGNAEAVRLLSAHGWHTPRTDRQGVTYMVRPGKRPGDGAGCSIGRTRPGLVYVFTSEAPPLLAEHGYRLPELYAALEHGGSRQAADAALMAASGLAGTHHHDAGFDAYVAAEHARAVSLGASATADEAPTSRYIDGATFLFNQGDDDTPSVWGHGENVLWAEGEPLLLVGPPGVGKTTIAGQILAGRLGVLPSVLGYPVTPSEGTILYLASDRPRQIARAHRRLFGPEHAELLEQRLIVWRGPPAQDLAQHPMTLIQMVREVGAGTVVLDSLKDMAIGLSNDEVGAGLNQAIQHVIAEGVEVLALHHQRKGQGGERPKRLEDVYGSTWIAAGAGSVLLVWGAAGDPVVELHHLKQPVVEIGPLRVEHDHRKGTSTVLTGFDFLGCVRGAGAVGRTTPEVARLWMSKAKATENETAKARRHLERLEGEGKIKRKGASMGGHGGSDGITWIMAETVEKDLEISAETAGNFPWEGGNF